MALFLGVGSQLRSANRTMGQIGQRQWGRMWWTHGIGTVKALQFLLTFLPCALLTEALSLLSSWCALIHP